MDVDGTGGAVVVRGPENCGRSAQPPMSRLGSLLKAAVGLEKALPRQRIGGSSGARNSLLRLRGTGQWPQNARKLTERSPKRLFHIVVQARHG